LRKPVMQIEPYRFGVLLVHVNTQLIARTAGMIQQRAANTCPADRVR
jgi:hypothetical protein